MSLIANGAGEQPTGFYNGVATQSLRLDHASDTKLTRTPDAGNRKTNTLSLWFKRSTLDGNQHIARFTGGGNSDTGHLDIYLDSSTKRLFVAGWSTYFRTTNRLFRDVSSWYHVVVAVDTTDSTADNRIKIYVNGVQETSFATNNAIGEDADTGINANGLHTLGDGYGGFNGYFAEVNFIEGSQLTPSSFGETKNGVWIPKRYTGSYGTNGFRLKFDQVGVGTASTSTIGADTSGNTHHFTSSGIVASDCAMPDSPENNFCTWNGLFRGGEQSASIYAAPTLSNGNLEVSIGQNSYVGNNFRPVSGKWYCEIRVKSMGTTNGEIDWGWLQATTYAGTSGHSGQANKWGAYYHAYSTDHIQVYDETSQLGSNINLTISAGSVLQLAWDIDNNKGWVGIDNTYYAADNGTDGNPSSGTNQTFTFTADEAQNLQVYIANGTSTDVHVANFGQDSTFGGDETATTNADANGNGTFHHAPPTGFLACCSANLSDDDLPISPNADTQADDHFNTVLYTGTGNANAITGVGFQPDWVWIKPRSASLYHFLTDSSRGVTHTLSSNVTQNEAFASEDVLSAFGSDGFTLTADDGSGYYGWNRNNDTLVAWNWKANGGTTTTNDASSSGVGSLDSVIQANQTAGFSIVLYTIPGTDVYTIAHGLSKAPDLIIHKGRDQTSAWWTVFTLLDGSVDYVGLEQTTAKANDTASLSAPTSTVFSQVVNYTLQQKVISYCFHSVEGYSKIGSYTGNGSADGTFVFTGFRPAFWLVKVASRTGNWIMYDNARDTFNTVDEGLFPNLDAAESTQNAGNIDFLSNGFKCRATGSAMNESGATYIYMAFAEAPFKYANAR